MTVYHGGAIEISAPDLFHSRKAVDFGPGFYVTPLKEQAIRWSAKRKARNGTAVVSIYELDEGIFSVLKTLRFDSYSEEWLDFIIACRNLRDASDWDFVVGGVANDKVFDTLEAFFDGFASKEQTIGRLRMAKPSLQICLRSEAALKALSFIGGERL